MEKILVLSTSFVYKFWCTLDNFGSVDYKVVLHTTLESRNVQRRTQWKVSKHWKEAMEWTLQSLGFHNFWAPFSPTGSRLKNCLILFPSFSKTSYLPNLEFTKISAFSRMSRTSTCPNFSNWSSKPPKFSTATLLSVHYRNSQN